MYAFLGDVNGDNIGDIAIGANKDDDGQNDAGAIYILFMAPMNLEIELQNSNTSCSPYNDADAQLIVTKGCPPYSIIWSTGDTTANIDSLGPGVYHVSISDSTGNLLVDSIIVESGDIEIVATDSHLCYGDSLDLMAIGSKTDSLVEVLSMHMDALVNINTLPTIAGDLYYMKMKGTWTGAGACESRDPFSTIVMAVKISPLTMQHHGNLIIFLLQNQSLMDTIQTMNISCTSLAAVVVKTFTFPTLIMGIIMEP